MARIGRTIPVRRWIDSQFPVPQPPPPAPTTYSNSFEGGTDGTGVTVANSGGASGDAWSDVAIGTTSTITYASSYTDPALAGGLQTVLPPHGTLMAHIHDGNSTDQQILTRNVLQTNRYAVRVYVFMASVSKSFVDTFKLTFNDGTGAIATISINQSAAGSVQDANGNSLGTFTASMDAWMRIEAQFDFGNKFYNVNLYHGDATTPDYTVTSTTGPTPVFSGRLPTSIKLFVQNTFNATGDTLLDSFAAAANSITPLGPDLLTTWTGTVAMSGSTGLSVDALVQEFATVSMTGDTTETVAPVVTTTGVMAMSATAGASITPAVTEVAAVSMAATASMPSITVSVLGATALSGSTSLTISGTVKEIASVSLAGATTLTVSPFVTKFATVALSATAGETVSAVLTRLGLVAQAATASLTAAGSVKVIASVAMADTTTLSITGIVLRTGAVALTGTTTFSVYGAVTYFGVVAESASAGMSVAAQTFILAVVPLSAQSGMLTILTLHVVSGLFKVWDGSQWTRALAREGWNGYHRAIVRTWDGTMWKRVR